MGKNNPYSAFPEVTTRDFRETIIDRVTSAIEAKGYQEFIKVPATSPRKVSFDAHIRLTDAGRIHFGERAVFSRQIIHPELKRLTISNEIVPVNILNRKDFFINHAVEQLEAYARGL